MTFIGNLNFLIGINKKRNYIALFSRISFFRCLIPRKNKKVIRTQYGELWRPSDALNVSRQRRHSLFGARPQYLLRYLLECLVKGGKHLVRYSGRVYLRSQTKVNNAVSALRVQIILEIHGQWLRARYRNMNTSDFLNSWRERTCCADCRMFVRQDQRYSGEYQSRANRSFSRSYNSVHRKVSCGFRISAVSFSTDNHSWLIIRCGLIYLVTSLLKFGAGNVIIFINSIFVM